MHIKECGSCTLNIPYDEQIELKKEYIRDEFGEFYSGEFEFFASTPIRYRTRAEFGVWHEADEICYTMGGKESRRIRIDECFKVDEKIAILMPKLLYALKSDERLKFKLFGVEFISCSSGVLATLLYHKRLDDSFAEVAKILARKLGVTILARSKGQKILSDELNLIDELRVSGENYKFNLSENAFIQPNKALNEKMIEWARGCVNDDAKDMLEIYCGHGNFTIPLAKKFNQVLATEISKKSIENALKNCELNGVGNIKFTRLSADELMQAFNKSREFRRLEGINLDSFNFSHILVDPPRAGLEDSVVRFIKSFVNIIYISCNPATLKENLKELCVSHEVVKFAIFDQFPNTNHIECGVLLRRKDAN